jgi:hypothetical protein
MSPATATASPTDSPINSHSGRRWPRILAIGLALLALGLGAAYVTLSRMFPPARLAELLAAEVKAATGRDFRIGGDLSIRLLPRRLLMPVFSCQQLVALALFGLMFLLMSRLSRFLPLIRTKWIFLAGIVSLISRASIPWQATKSLLSLQWHF